MYRPRSVCSHTYLVLIVKLSSHYCLFLKDTLILTCMLGWWRSEWSGKLTILCSHLWRLWRGPAWFCFWNRSSGQTMSSFFLQIDVGRHISFLFHQDSPCRPFERNFALLAGFSMGQNLNFCLKETKEDVLSAPGIRLYNDTCWGSIWIFTNSVKGPPRISLPHSMAEVTSESKIIFLMWYGLCWPWS